MRFLANTLANHFAAHPQAAVILGSRQAGKTTLAHNIFPGATYLLVDNDPVRRILDAYDIHAYRALIPESVDTVLIDEIHLLKDPGRAVKILYDQIPGLKIVVTGSSSFHIKNRMSESLAGRKIDYILHPLSFAEYLFQKKIVPELSDAFLHSLADPEEAIPQERIYPFDMAAILDNTLLYGLYPFLVDHPNDTAYLRNFADSLIYKDLLELNLIENKRVAADLLKLLAHQIGNIVNYAELADKLRADQRTVKRYIEIFEQSFLVFRLYPFTSRRENEIVKSPKVYFFDTGLRNAIINDFSPLTARRDKGALFENFIIAEAWKQNAYTNRVRGLNYWRTKSGSEVDLVLDTPSHTVAIEIKNARHTAPSRGFLSHYPDAVPKTLTANNFWA